MTLPAKPSTAVQAWATDGLYTSGLDDGLDTKLAPTAGEKAQGYHRGKRPPARKMNFLFHWIHQWLGWSETALDDLDSRIESGDYSPTISAQSNVSGMTSVAARYLRIGTVVIVYFHVTGSATGSGDKSFRLTLPVEPVGNFSATEEVTGCLGALSSTAEDPVATVLAVTSLKLASVSWTNTAASGAQSFSGSFSYKVS